MAQAALTERQLRERKYYDHFVARGVVAVGSLAAVRGEERRPWNPYWFVTGKVRERFTTSTQRLLDFGCGPGTYSVQFAHLGYRVTGVDVSPGNVETARAMAARYGMSERTQFDVGVAEALDYPSSHFDIVVGIDILHHVEVASAAAECLRVLKPDGIAIFKEPVAVPLFDRLRNSRLGCAIRPKDVSFDLHITEDERKLTPADLRLIGAMWSVEEHRFRLLSRLDTLTGERFKTVAGASRLEIVDGQLLRVLPMLRVLGGSVVLLCRPSMRRGEVRDVR
jgi:SAM-dependent methyltransferase